MGENSTPQREKMGKNPILQRAGCCIIRKKKQIEIIFEVMWHILNFLVHQTI